MGNNTKETGHHSNENSDTRQTSDNTAAKAITHQAINIRSLLPFLIAAQRQDKMQEVINTLKSLTKDDPDAAIMMPASLWLKLATALAVFGICTRGIASHTPALAIKGTLVRILATGGYRVEFDMSTSNPDVSITPTICTLRNDTAGTASPALPVTGKSGGFYYVDFPGPITGWASGDSITVMVGFTASSPICTEPSPDTGSLSEPAVLT